MILSHDCPKSNWLQGAIARVTLSTSVEYRICRRTTGFPGASHHNLHHFAAEGCLTSEFSSMRKPDRLKPLTGGALGRYLAPGAKWLPALLNLNRRNNHQQSPKRHHLHKRDPRATAWLTTSKKTTFSARGVREGQPKRDKYPWWSCRKTSLETPQDSSTFQQHRLSDIATSQSRGKPVVTGALTAEPLGGLKGCRRTTLWILDNCATFKMQTSCPQKDALAESPWSVSPQSGGLLTEAGNFLTKHLGHEN